jgi:hypothetical protein
MSDRRRKHSKNHARKSSKKLRGYAKKTPGQKKEKCMVFPTLEKIDASPPVYKKHKEGRRQMKGMSNIILQVLWGLSIKANSLKFSVTQKVLLRKIKQKTGKTLSRATLYNYLKDYEKGGFIERTQIRKKDERGRPLFRPTLYKLTPRAIEWAESRYQWAMDMEKPLRTEFEGRHNYI